MCRYVLDSYKSSVPVKVSRSASYQMKYTNPTRPNCTKDDVGVLIMHAAHIAHNIYFPLVCKSCQSCTSKASSSSVTRVHAVFSSLSSLFLSFLSVSLCLLSTRGSRSLWCIVYLISNRVVATNLSWWKPQREKPALFLSLSLSPCFRWQSMPAFHGHFGENWILQGLKRGCSMFSWSKE